VKDVLQTRSGEILAQLAPQNPTETQPPKGKKTKKGKKSQTSDSERHLFKNLFDAYSNTQSYIVSDVYTSSIINLRTVNLSTPISRKKVS